MSDYRVKLSPNTNKFKVTAIPGGLMVPARFEDLLNFDYTQKSDKYVIMYDAATQKYKLVNPDEVLSASSNTETTQPGLPNDFINTLDVNLDNKIDLDAGEF